MSGRLVWILTAPPVVFLPNSVPCGPRSTSTLAKSNVSSNCVCTLGITKSSTCTPTGESWYTMMSVRPTPRIANDAALNAVMRDAEKPGTDVAMPEISCATMRSMSSAVTADTEIGVCCRSVVPARVAVTSTSSRPLASGSAGQRDHGRGARSGGKYCRNDASDLRCFWSGANES